jgi:hypothetical protein
MLKLRKILLLTFCVITIFSLLSPPLAFGQSLRYYLMWGSFCSPATSDIPFGMAISPDRNIYVVGDTTLTSPIGSGIDEPFIIKFDRDGNLLWQKTVGLNTGSGAATSVAIGPDGSVYVAGEGAPGVLILKLDAGGNLLWQKAWTAFGYTGTQSIDVDPDGNVYVTTSAFPIGTIGILKIDPNGVLLAEKSITSGITMALGDGISISPNGSIYIGGYVPSPSSVTNDVEVIKLDPQTLTPLWAKKWGTPVDEIITGIDASNTGVVVSVDGLAPTFNKHVLKFDPDGNLVLEKNFPTS